MNKNGRIGAGGARDSPVLDHAHRSHALLSASAAKRWLNCPPSARLNDQFPDETSVYAAEGTFMHEVCEYKIRHDYLHERMRRPQSEEFYTDEVEDVTDVYAQFVIETIEEMKKTGSPPLILIEEKLDYSHVVPSGFGTGDMVLIGKTVGGDDGDDGDDGRGLLHVIDFKGGRGVFVSSDHNPQMMLYAVGALHAYGFIYDIEVVRMSIVQPRLSNISTFEMSADELMTWAESIMPIAQMAYEGRGEQKPGDWCRFCKAKPVCKACLDEALALAREEFIDLDDTPDHPILDDSPFQPELDLAVEADKLSTGGGGVAEEAVDTAESEVTDATAPYSCDTGTVVFKSPGLVPISELAAVMPTLNRIASWIDSVFAFVANEAINHGVEVPGYKVVEGRSKRVFSDIKGVVEAAAEAGYTDVYKKELISLTEFEKMMGKKRFAEVLGKYVLKPPGKLSLVPESDPRDAVVLESSTVSDEFEALE